MNQEKPPEPIALHPQNRKSFFPCFILCSVFGYLGAHRFYVGKVGTGLLMLVTIGGLGFWVLIDMIMIILHKFRDSDGQLLEFPQIKTVEANQKSEKSYVISLFLSAFLGFLGINSFYVGKLLHGILQLCTFGGFGIWAMYDTLSIVFLNYEDGQGKTLYPSLAHEHERREKSASPFRGTLLRSVILGPFGAHRFYTGKNVTGFLMLITFFVSWIWNLVDIYLIATLQFRDKQGQLVLSPK